MRNHEVTEQHPLLNEKGELQEPGWSRSLIQAYSRNQIKASAFRIKEWDYYLMIGNGFGVAFTISDAGYIGLQSVSLLDFQRKWEHTETILNAFPMGKLHMPSTSEEGNVHYEDKRLSLHFEKHDQTRQIQCQFKNFYQGKTFTCDILLHQPPMDTMVIATPWKNKTHAFYYNQKINGMRAEGKVEFDGKTYIFHPETDFGTLDWGRGVWTYDNTWYWSSGNGIVQGKPFGFNLGYGFGDTSAATENMLFYDGIGHKLDDVTFHIPKDDMMKPWTFTSSDQRFEMKFRPILDRAAKTSAVLIVTDQHQVFGYMSGTAILDDGTVLPIDDLLCFAEVVHNRY
ncbi:MAG: DUF2804 domain-containing protein [Erysipelotrichaceae bacterium]|nr:DUF2804 domain-containing protein [Erysipelotrichaceae bacterium]